MPRGGVAQGPLPGAKGLLYSVPDGQLPCDLSHECHRQTLPDLQKGLGLRPTAQVGRGPLGSRGYRRVSITFPSRGKELEPENLWDY